MKLPTEDKKRTIMSDKPYDTSGRALVPCFRQCLGGEKKRSQSADGKTLVLFRCAKFNEDWKTLRQFRLTNPPEGCPLKEEHEGWHTPKNIPPKGKRPPYIRDDFGMPIQQKEIE